MGVAIGAAEKVFPQKEISYCNRLYLLYSFDHVKMFQSLLIGIPPQTITSQIR